MDRERLIGLTFALAFAAQACSGSAASVAPSASTQPTPTKAAATATAGSTKTESTYPACPADLTGILTAPLMDPEHIAALTPLGNLNPPGHTSPVDHIYFATTETGHIPLKAPADAWITRVVVQSVRDAAGNYSPDGFTITYTICQGVQLDLASHADVSDGLKSELARLTGQCAFHDRKPGHTDYGDSQCIYQLNYPVKAGDELGWVQTVPTDHGMDLPFEVWASNYNHTTRDDVNWDYYTSYDSFYPYAVCLFDLYSGDLRTSYYAKFGMYGQKDKKGGPWLFTPRTIEPRCGQITQDLFGALQGMWFAGPADGKTNYEFQGKGLAFVHNNIDPSKAEISVGGFITPAAGISMFAPKHSGTVDREPSEVKADGQIYCYNTNGAASTLGGKILAQVVDDHHITVEHQSGTCGSSAAFKNPQSYQR
jgi:hypothetical protein